MTGADFIETHRSFVNTWECDENGHMNVQFYLRRFDEAARFMALSEGSGTDGALPALRSIRYHGELHAADITTIRTARVGAGELTGSLVHLMEDAATGALCATALDLPREPRAVASGVELPAPAAPRSYSAEPARPISAADLLARGGLVTHRRILQPADCDLRGEMLAQTYLSIGSDAAPHVWQHSGYGSAGLIRNGYGRIAVEMRLTHHRPGQAGEAVTMVSAPAEITGRTIRLHHELVRAADHSPLATLEVVAMLLDLSTRKSLPEAKLRELVGAT